MKLAYIITHPDVIIDPQVPVPEWPLSAAGQERMRKLFNQTWVATLGAVYCSAERKAMDGADILATHLGLSYHIVPDLGEVDRSSTGYLPRSEHDAAARELFDHPDQSIHGWETARAAQARIIGAVEAAIDRDQSNNRNLAIVSHGGVATLYLCHIKRCPISRGEIPPPGKNGGYYYCFDIETKSLVHDWKPIDG